VRGVTTQNTESETPKSKIVKSIIPKPKNRNLLYRMPNYQKSKYRGYFSELKKPKIQNTEARNIESQRSEIFNFFLLKMKNHRKILWRLEKLFEYVGCFTAFSFLLAFQSSPSISAHVQKSKSKNFFLISLSKYKNNTLLDTWQSSFPRI